MPEDVALVGFDDNPLNDWVAPWLSSVRVPHALFGPSVCSALEAVWAGEAVDSAPLPHVLVVRSGRLLGIRS